MSKLAFGIVCFFIVIAGVTLHDQFVYAAEPGTGCVKAKLRGVATTYDPRHSGWKTGGPKNAFGEPYNPNEFRAALKLSYAQKFKCGSGSKCHAAVEGNGKAMIVLVDDNGPMCDDPATAASARRAGDCMGGSTDRIIDLNARSMQYMSGGKYTPNSGTIKEVTVTLLCDFNAKLGPLDEKERAAWAQKAANVPLTAESRVTPTGYPTTVGTPTGGTPGQSQSSYYEKADFSNYHSPQPYSPTGQQLTPSNYFSSSGSGLFDPITGEPRSTVSASDSLLKLLKGSTALKQPSTTLSIIVASGKQASLVPTVKTKISQQTAQKSTTSGATFTGPYAGTPRSGSSFQTTLSDIQDQIASILKMLGDLVR